jgi:hypothetical protein
MRKGIMATKYTVDTPLSLDLSAALLLALLVALALALALALELTLALALALALALTLALALSLTQGTGLAVEDGRLLAHALRAHLTHGRTRTNRLTPLAPAGIADLREVDPTLDPLIPLQQWTDLASRPCVNGSFRRY